LTTDPNELARAFGIETAPGWLAEAIPRYNLSPTEPLIAIRKETGRANPAFARLRWGLVPSWADDPAIGARMINARSETVAEKPAFRRAFSRRRCLIPVDGFYEWRRDGGRRRPYWFHAPERRPFALAGLWERWQNPTLGEPLESCAILTTAANAVMQPIHDRMPVILSPSAYGTWLAPLPRRLATRPRRHATRQSSGLRRTCVRRTDSRGRGRKYGRRGPAGDDPGRPPWPPRQRARADRSLRRRGRPRRCTRPAASKGAMK
jgi:putative SOS response-associated peptidase YedK